MMRDHLLGCQAYAPPEDDGLTRHQRPFALGVPERVYAEHRARYAKAATEQSRLVEFETDDHTPEAMRKDFPHEYDFGTLLSDAGLKFYVDFAKDYDQSAILKYFCSGFDGMPHEVNAQTCNNAKPPENKSASGLSMLIAETRNRKRPLW